MNFLEISFLWTMIATIILGLISIIYIGLFKMGLFTRVKSKIQTSENKRQCKSSFLDFSLLSKDVRIRPGIKNRSDELEKRHVDSSRAFFKSEWKKLRSDKNWNAEYGESTEALDECKCFKENAYT